MTPIDLQKYPIASFVQVIRFSSEYKAAVAEKETWEEVVKVIDTMKILYTKEQIQALKDKDWTF